MNKPTLQLRNELLAEDGLLVVHDWERQHYKPILNLGTYQTKILRCEKAP